VSPVYPWRCPSPPGAGPALLPPEGNPLLQRGREGVTLCYPHWPLVRCGRDLRCSYWGRACSPCAPPPPVPAGTPPTGTPLLGKGDARPLPPRQHPLAPQTPSDGSPGWVSGRESSPGVRLSLKHSWLRAHACADLGSRLFRESSGRSETLACGRVLSPARAPVPGLEAVLATVAASALLPVLVPVLVGHVEGG